MKFISLILKKKASVAGALSMAVGAVGNPGEEIGEAWNPGEEFGWIFVS